MKLQAVDQEKSLFQISELVSDSLVNVILSTPWTELKKIKQSGQERWTRDLIVEASIPWIDQWHSEMNELWPALEEKLNCSIGPYVGTAFWLDPAGFVCPVHTDGEMPGSMHLNWIGDSSLGTAFYHFQNAGALRFQSTFAPNNGYVMINRADQSGYRKLQWHGMLNPVPKNSFRITSYTWIKPIK
jgi:hypothetical protein